MTDPSDDNAPVPAAAAANVPAGVGANVPAGAPGPVIADRDGGVARRLTVRCRIASSVLLALGALLLLLGILRTWTVSSALVVLLAAGALAWAATLALRARLWMSVASARLTGVGGRRAIVGPPQRLSTGIAGAPLKRRLGAMVVPIHTEVDPQPGGGALVVHARVDGLELAGGDEVRVGPATRAGFRSTRLNGAGPTEPTTSGRFVLSRPSDGAVFLATTRLSDTW